MARIRVVHFLNQFFAGLGGEEQAEMEPQLFTGPLGCGTFLAERLGADYQVVATLVAGDNYQATRAEDRIAAYLPLVQDMAPDLLIAGPAFACGRYSMACASLCLAVSQALGIRSVAALDPESPGAELYGALQETVPTTGGVGRMDTALDTLAAAVRRGCQLMPDAGKAAVRLPRQVSEPLPGLAQSRIALVTTCGLTDRNRTTGRFGARSSAEWDLIPVPPDARFDPNEHEVVHPGFWHAAASADLERIIPLETLMARATVGDLGGVVPFVSAICGFGRSLKDGWDLGVKLAHHLRLKGTDAVLLTSS